MRKLGISYDSISKKLKIPKSSVRNIIKQYEETGSTEPNEKSGRPVLIGEKTA